MGQLAPFVFKVLAVLLFLPAQVGLFNAVVEYRAIEAPRFEGRLAPNSPVVPVLDHEMAGIGDHGFDELVAIAAGVTAQRLHYTSSGTGDPDAAWRRRGVNCLGYSALFAASLNYLLEQTGQADRYHAKVVTGRLALLGWEFQRWGPFPRHFPSHEYNCVEELTDGRIVVRHYFDANIYDYIRVLRVRGSAFADCLQSGGGT